MSDADALHDATLPAPEILRVLAMACWEAEEPAAPCPESQIPGIGDFMTAVAPAGGFTESWEAASAACNERLLACVAAISFETWQALQAEASAYRLELRQRFDVPEGEHLQTPPEAYEETAGVWYIAEPHRVWCAAVNAKPDAGIKHPLGEYMRMWQARARTVEPETRQDARILPRIDMGRVHPDREIGMLFAGLHEGRRIEAPELPLWEGAPARKRVPILDVVDAAGVPVVQRGGAPIPLRLFVRALSSVPPSERGAQSVRLAVEVGELLDAIWPVSPTTGRRTWRAGEHWPKLRHALEHVSDYAIHNGKGRWFPLALRSLPDELRLDDEVVLDVAFPPGAMSGPEVSLPDMDRLMVSSVSRWRAFIAAHCIAWIPGITRVPVIGRDGKPVTGKGGRRIVTWTRNVAAYPILTRDDMRRLAYGVDRHERKRWEIEKAFRKLPGLVVLDESAHDERTGEVGFRVVPDEAAKAIGRKL